MVGYRLDLQGEGEGRQREREREDRNQRQLGFKEMPMRGEAKRGKTRLVTRGSQGLHETVRL